MNEASEYIYVRAEVIDGNVKIDHIRVVMGSEDEVLRVGKLLFPPHDQKAIFAEKVFKI